MQFDTACKMNIKEEERGVAQSGSAPGLGPGGRRFESCRPDIFHNDMASALLEG